MVPSTNNANPHLGQYIIGLNQENFKQPYKINYVFDKNNSSRYQKMTD
ncbi:hypothetical protein AO372_0229 [Moraxella catarrhalis]|nr:hypothetical protein EJK50_0232 [Moraxella catarrhalis]OAV05090.1 hypothetical protein AO379_1823 [Moraxella catarrhalis]OAV08811.1 hypothetical protein AO377_1471 [Moraxella catarrhalis]OAV12709.1 hypothetical protein AO375_1683 [Moraxella catarrhalis]OAV14991.1 hypothetical protein AO376_0707 [Moraxella catarrhalis]